MKTKSHLNLKKLIQIMFLAAILSGCVTLLAPKVEDQIVSLKAGQYTLDKTHATILFKIKHMGLSTYVGRFNKFDASLDFDPANISITKLNAVIEMGSLDINNDELKNDLMGRKWFRQKDFPLAKFSTTSVTPISDSKIEFAGKLDWRGVVKPITLEVVFHGGASNILTGKYTLGFSARGSFLRSDYGMDAYIPVVGDKVQLETYAEFQRK